MPNHPNRSRAKSPASNQIEKKGNHGGKRTGAGAPTHNDLGKKIKRTYSLSLDVIAILDASRPSSRFIERAVRAYAQQQINLSAPHQSYTALSDPLPDSERDP